MRKPTTIYATALSALVMCLTSPTAMPHAAQDLPGTSSHARADTSSARTPATTFDGKILSGRVTDSSDGSPVQFADVLARDSEGKVVASAMTDKDGNYSLAVPAGTATIEVHLIGYDSLTVSPDKASRITLKKSEEGLDGVTVTAEKDRIVYRLGKQTVSTSQAVTASGGTALDILTTTPSVQLDADGELSFRGSTNYLVYIDGKPSPLSGSDALRQIPAAGIEDIEIITTPSARYRTDGDVGIINVRTKSSETPAWSGALSTTASTHGTWGADGLLNYRKGHSLFYIGGTAQDIITKSDFLQDKKTIVDDYTTVSHSDGYRYRTFKTMVAKGGWKYDDGTHSIGIDLQAGRTRNTRGGYMLYDETRTYEDAPLSDGTFDAHDHYVLFKKLAQASLDYGWKLSSRTTLAATSRLRYDRYSLEYTESNLHTLEGVRTEGTRGYEEEHHWDSDGSLTLTHDYSATGRLEGGYQYVTYSEHGGYTFKAWDTAAQDFLWDESLDIPFYYRRQVHTLYAMASDHPGNWDFDAGVRGEEVIDRMDIEMAGASRFSRRFELFPSAHVGYRTPGAGTFTLGYSRRTNRPGIWKLEPYITYEDYYTRIVGNPDLKSEYINSGELAWRRTMGETSLMATAYFRHRTDVVDVIRMPYDAGITLDKIVNAGDRSEYGLEMSIQSRPAKWWSTTLNGSAFRYDFKATLPECTDASGFTYMAGWINVFSPFKATKVQLDSHFVGPNALTQGREEAYCFFDLAARQQLLKGRLALSVVAHDLFHTAKYENLRTTACLESHTIVRPQYPSITFGAVLTFNSKPKEKSGAISADASFDGKDF